MSIENINHKDIYCEKNETKLLNNLAKWLSNNNAQQSQFTSLTKNMDQRGQIPKRYDFFNSIFDIENDKSIKIKKIQKLEAKMEEKAKKLKFLL